MCPFPTAPTWGADLHIRLLGAARAEIDPSWWHWEEVERPFWRLFLAEAPGVVFRLGDRMQPLPAGRLCFVPPMPPSTYWTEAPIEIVFAHFDVIGLPKLVMDEVFSTPIILDERPDVESAFRSVQNRDWFVTPELAAACAVKAVVYTGLGHWIESISADRLAELRSKTLLLEPLQPALLFIEEHLGERITNRKLAEACFMSEDHFIRVFHGRTGQSPAQYVLERRLHLAAELLLFSKESIESIASRCGFRSRSSFTRAFSRRRGGPPGAYRRYERRDVLDVDRAIAADERLV